MVEVTTQTIDTIQTQGFLDWLFGGDGLNDQVEELQNTLENTVARVNQLSSANLIDRVSTIENVIRGGISSPLTGVVNSLRQDVESVSSQVSTLSTTVSVQGRGLSNVAKISGTVSAAIGKLLGGYFESFSFDFLEKIRSVAGNVFSNGLTTFFQRLTDANRYDKGIVDTLQVAEVPLVVPGGFVSPTAFFENLISGVSRLASPSYIRAYIMNTFRVTIDGQDVDLITGVQLLKGKITNILSVVPEQVKQRLELLARQIEQTVRAAVIPIKNDVFAFVENLWSEARGTVSTIRGHLRAGLSSVGINYDTPVNGNPSADPPQPSWAEQVSNRVVASVGNRWGIDVSSGDAFFNSVYENLSENRYFGRLLTTLSSWTDTVKGFLTDLNQTLQDLFVSQEAKQHWIRANTSMKFFASRVAQAFRRLGQPVTLGPSEEFIDDLYYLFTKGGYGLISKTVVNRENFGKLITGASDLSAKVLEAVGVRALWIMKTEARLQMFNTEIVMGFKYLTQSISAFFKMVTAWFRNLFEGVTSLLEKAGLDVGSLTIPGSVTGNWEFLDFDTYLADNFPSG